MDERAGVFKALLIMHLQSVFMASRTTGLTGPCPGKMTVNT